MPGKPKPGQIRKRRFTDDRDYTSCRGRTRCTARSRQTGRRCKNSATDGSYNCRFHGGVVGRSAARSRYKTHFGPTMRETFEDMLAEPVDQAVNISEELALMRTLLSENLGTLNIACNNGDGSAEDEEVRARMRGVVIGMVDQVTNVAERMARIETRVNASIPLTLVRQFIAAVVAAIEDALKGNEHLMAKVMTELGRVRVPVRDITGSRSVMGSDTDVGKDIGEEGAVESQLVHEDPI